MPLPAASARCALRRLSSLRFSRAAAPADGTDGARCGGRPRLPGTFRGFRGVVRSASRPRSTCTSSQSPRIMVSAPSASNTTCISGAASTASSSTRSWIRKPFRPSVCSSYRSSWRTSTCTHRSRSSGCRFAISSSARAALMRVRSSIAGSARTAVTGSTDAAPIIPSTSGRSSLAKSSSRSCTSRSASGAAACDAASCPSARHACSGA